MKRTHSIYALLDDKDCLFYIGQSVNVKNRLSEHLCSAKRGRVGFVYNKIRKVLSSGSNIKMKVLSSGLSSELADDLEIQLISFYGKSMNGDGPLTNILDGGSVGLGYIPSKETREKISKNGKRYWATQDTEEHRAKISKTAKANFASGARIHHMLGKKHTSEAREKIRQAGIGRKWSKSQRAKMKKIQKYNKPSNTKNWIVSDPNGKKINVFGLSGFCREHSLNHSHMISVANGDRKHHKGWTCKRIERKIKHGT